MGTDTFDVIVVGTGVTGQTAGAELARAGRRVAVVDRRAFGGTCPQRGCEPKKVLCEAAVAVERPTAQAGHGPSGRVALDWPQAVAYKRTYTDPVPERIEAYFRDAGAVPLHGDAAFTSPDTLRIDGVEYSPDQVVIAAGAHPQPLGMEGEELVMSSEDFMAAERLGRRVVFIGGGYISFEFAHMAHAAGSHVTIVHRSAQVLKGFDGQLASMLAESYRRRGIAVLTDSPVERVLRTLDGLEVQVSGGDSLPCDMVVHGAGRVPDLAGLDLERGGVEAGRRGIAVDQGLRSVSNPRVYAAGDAAALGPPLTPVGIAQARVVVRRILGEESARFEPPIIPSVVFADPPLASVGLTEEGARPAGLEVDVLFNDMSGWVSSRRVGVDAAGSRILVERGGGRVLGAHLLGHNADEVVNVFATAITAGMTADQLRSVLWAYPTASSEIVYLV